MMRIINSSILYDAGKQHYADNKDIGNIITILHTVGQTKKDNVSYCVPPDIRIFVRVTF